MPRFAFNGGVSGVRRVPTASAAPGIWDLHQQNEAKRAGIWPIQSFSGPYTPYLTVVDGATGGTGTWYTPNNNPANAFDGNPATSVGADNGSYIKFYPPGPIAFNTSLEIGDNMENNYDSVTLYTPNGSITKTASAGKVVFDGPGTLLYLTVQDRPPTYYVVGFGYIKVDGVELVDPA